MVLLVQLALMADISWWGWIYLGQTKPLMDLYCRKVFRLMYDVFEWSFVIVNIGESFYCVGYWRVLWLLLFVINFILVYVLVIFYGRFWVIIIGIGRIDMLMGLWVWGQGFNGRGLFWRWSLFILFCSLPFGDFIWGGKVQGRGRSNWIFQGEFISSIMFLFIYIYILRLWVFL